MLSAYLKLFVTCPLVFDPANSSTCLKIYEVTKDGLKKKGEKYLSQLRQKEAPLLEEKLDRM